MTKNEVKAQPPAEQPPGWYEDESSSKIQRWWSGESWSDYTRPTPQLVPPGFEDVAAAPSIAVGPADSDSDVVKGRVARTGAKALGTVVTWWRHQKTFVKVLSLVGLLAVFVLVFAVLLPMVLRPTHHLQGVLALSGDVSSFISGSPDVEGEWDSCNGAGGYSDFKAGAPATIRDGEGNIVGQLEVRNFNTNTLDAMLTADAKAKFAGWGDDAAEAKSLIESGADLGISCLLYVEGDVKDSDFYTFTFSHRGELSYSREQLAKQDWWISLTLGG